MTATGQDFIMWAGDYREVVYTVAGITDVDTVLAVDWRMEQFAGGVHSVDKSLTDGITMADTTGVLVVTVTLDPGDTEEHVGVYNHELQVTNGVGRPETVAVGRLTVNTALIVPQLP